jgi:hypothetical protein
MLGTESEYASSVDSADVNEAQKLRARQKTIASGLPIQTITSIQTSASSFVVLHGSERRRQSAMTVHCGFECGGEVW